MVSLFVEFVVIPYVASQAADIVLSPTIYYQEAASVVIILTIVLSFMSL